MATICTLPEPNLGTYLVKGLRHEPRRLEGLRRFSEMHVFLYFLLLQQTYKVWFDSMLYICLRFSAFINILAIPRNCMPAILAAWHVTGFEQLHYALLATR